MPARLCRSVIAFAAILGATTTAAAQTYTFERTFPAGSVARLEISTHRGHITVTASDDGETVVSANVTVRTGFNMPLNGGQIASGVAAHPPIQSRGLSVQIGPPSDPLADRAVTIDYDIKVPPPTTIVAVTDSGAVTIKGLAGAVSVHTQSGTIDATPAASLAATLDATSASGAIDVDAGLVDGAVEKGRVRGTIHGGGAAWQLVTKTGAIRLHAPTPPA